MIKLLDSHLLESGAPDSLRHLIMYMARAAKYIHYYIQTGDLGLSGTSNTSGDQQFALDIIADKVITDNLMICRLVEAAASEEKEQEIPCIHSDHKERYSVAFDPLDGSSLVDANLAIGSILSIYPSGGFVGKTGRDQVAALYMLYGPRTTIVYSIGKGVHEFVLNDVGEFTLLKENITINAEAKYFAPGNLREAGTNSQHRAWLDSCLSDGKTLRYSGSMAADLHHIFSKQSGIFTYPASAKKYPEGKLRLLFECNPFAFLVEQAGGISSNGKQNILDIKITDIHQRTPIFIGSKNEVEKTVGYFAK